MNGFDKPVLSEAEGLTTPFRVSLTSLIELYTRTPVEEHGNIIVAGDRVYVRSAEGTEEYVLLADSEVKLVRSDKANPLAAIRQDLAAIKAKMGI